MVPANWQNYTALWRAGYRPHSNCQCQGLQKFVFSAGEVGETKIQETTQAAETSPHIPQEGRGSLYLFLRSIAGFEAAGCHAPHFSRHPTVSRSGFEFRLCRAAGPYSVTLSAACLLSKSHLAAPLDPQSSGGDSELFPVRI